MVIPCEVISLQGSIHPVEIVGLSEETLVAEVRDKALAAAFGDAPPAPAWMFRVADANGDFHAENTLARFVLARPLRIVQRG